jgi:hypothetical protein
VKWICAPAVLAATVLAAACGSGAGASAPSPVRTADGRFVPDGPSPSAVVWAVGDAAPGPGAPKGARLVAKGKPDAILYLGDVYPFGTAGAYRHGFARTYGALAKLTAPTPGNHDWPFRRGGYDSYWSGVRGTPAPPWYAFSAGGWQLLSLNSETGSRSAQLKWLRGQVKGKGSCRLAFWHRPRFSAGLHGDTASMDPYWRALRGHARLVVSGHDHDMQRMRPRGGLIQYVSGAGGHSHYHLDRSYRALAFGDDRQWGALRIMLRPGSAQLDFFADSGRRLDSSRVSCARV